MTSQQLSGQPELQKAALKEVTLDVALIRHLTPMPTSTIKVVTWRAPKETWMV